MAEGSHDVERQEHDKEQMRRNRPGGAAAIDANGTCQKAPWIERSTPIIKPE
jgi:hypothetical protein